ncbi:MAG TPA: carboxypeptidase regulatory-like domain-containing protein [Terriglobales bacterium]|nr:carboxypeptidase regulatory-like domain-containing protein [Terriglobales bacterium]
MRATSWGVSYLFLFLSALLSAQPKSPLAAGRTGTAAATPVEPSRLPVKRVVLYKNGVGYFEHSARVHGDQELGIDFTTAQLNDVIKSLTVVDLGDGRISSVRYNSIAPLGERLKTLRLPFGEQISRTDFLTALRGARVEVRAKTETAIGRLLSVEQQERTSDTGSSYQATLFSVLTELGEMKNFELGPGVSVRLADRDLNDEVGRYLALVGSSRARDLRRMTISASGRGEREIFVSYISEVPVWKSTYRIILPEKENEKPLLQGWAIVDNTIGEDWKDVQLSLIAGAPQSFIQDLSQPLYARRPVIPLPESAMLTPQTHEATIEADRLDQPVESAPPPPAKGVVGGVPGGVAGGQAGGVVARLLSGPPGTLAGIVTDASGEAVAGATVTARDQQGFPQSAATDSSGHYQLSVTAGTYDVTIEANGFSSYTAKSYVGVAQATELNATLNLTSTAETVTVEAASAQISPEVEAARIGDYFQYNLTQKITIGKNQSALVPILQSRIEAEKVTLWSLGEEEDGEHVPLRAVWLKNTSSQMLDSGTFNILEDGAFAGEGVLQSIHPDEKRLLSYAADTAIHVRTEAEASNERYSRVKIAKGLMILTREEREKTKFHIRNADKSGRVVVLEVPARDGWTFSKDTPKPEESTTSFHRFRVPVAGGKTAELTIEAIHPQDTRYALTNLDSNLVAILGQQQRITPPMRQVFDQILAHRMKVSRLDQQMIERRQETDRISGDQNRIRENMKALKGSLEEKALVERYTGELNKQEDRLSAIGTELGDLQRKRNEAAAELDGVVTATTIDQTF